MGLSVVSCQWSVVRQTLADSCSTLSSLLPTARSLLSSSDELLADSCSTLNSLLPTAYCLLSGPSGHPVDRFAERESRLGTRLGDRQRRGGGGPWRRPPRAIGFPPGRPPGAPLNASPAPTESHASNSRGRTQLLRARGDQAAAAPRVITTATRPSSNQPIAHRPNPRRVRRPSHPRQCQRLDAVGCDDVDAREQRRCCEISDDAGTGPDSGSPAFRREMPRSSPGGRIDRDFQPRQQHVASLKDRFRQAVDVLRAELVVGARSDADHVLTVFIDEDQGHARRNAVTDPGMADVDPFRRYSKCGLPRSSEPTAVTKRPRRRRGGPPPPGWLPCHQASSQMRSPAPSAQATAAEAIAPSYPCCSIQRQRIFCICQWSVVSCPLLYFTRSVLTPTRSVSEASQRISSLTLRVGISPCGRFSHQPEASARPPGRPVGGQWSVVIPQAASFSHQPEASARPRNGYPR